METLSMQVWTIFILSMVLAMILIGSIWCLSASLYAIERAIDKHRESVVASYQQVSKSLNNKGLRKIAPQKQRQMQVTSKLEQVKTEEKQETNHATSSFRA